MEHKAIERLLRDEWNEWVCRELGTSLESGRNRVELTLNAVDVVIDFEQSTVTVSALWADDEDDGVIPSSTVSLAQFREMVDARRAVTGPEWEQLLD